MKTVDWGAFKYSSLIPTYHIQFPPLPGHRPLIAPFPVKMLNVVFSFLVHQIYGYSIKNLDILWVFFVTRLDFATLTRILCVPASPSPHTQYPAYPLARVTFALQLSLPFIYTLCAPAPPLISTTSCCATQNSPGRQRLSF